MANDMYNYIFVYGWEDLVKQFQEDALDHRFLISHAYSYQYALTQHQAPIWPYQREHVREILRHDPAAMVQIDQELGERLYRSKIVYGHWQHKDMDDRYYCFDKEVLGSITEPEGNRILLVTFTTAWIPMPSLVEDFSRAYPNLDFTYYYIEERQVAFNGRMRFQKGQCYENFEAEPYTAEAYWLARKFISKEEIARHYYYDFQKHRYILM